MTGASVGVMHMPRKPVATALTTCALLVSGLMLSAPAGAEWSQPGDLTKYRLCRASADGGDTWRFVSKVRKYAATPDARAGINVFSGNERVAHWSSGWLKRGEVQVSVVRVTKSPKVRVYIAERAGDRDSAIGTALQSTMLKPRRIRRC